MKIKHKAVIGYAILSIGVGISLTRSSEAVSAANERGERQAAVICEATTRQDRQSLANLYTKSGHELIRELHLTIPQARVLVDRQLVASAEERKLLRPSSPRDACTDRVTTLTAAVDPPQ